MRSRFPCSWRLESPAQAWIGTFKIPDVLASTIAIVTTHYPLSNILDMTINIAPTPNVNNPDVIKSEATKQDNPVCIRITENIERRQWEAVTADLERENVAVDRCNAKCAPKCKSRHNVLFFACQRRAPLSVIKRIYELYPEAVFEADCMWRQPLHIAIKNCAELDTIDFLISKNPQAVLRRDRKGKSPLHLACEYFECKIPREKINDYTQEERYKLTEMALYQLMSTLIDNVPQSLLLEDSKGKDPLEYAITHKRHYKTIKMMQSRAKSIRKCLGLRRLTCLDNYTTSRRHSHSSITKAII